MNKVKPVPEKIFLETIETFNNTDPWKHIDWRKYESSICKMHNRIMVYTVNNNNLPHTYLEMCRWENNYFKEN